MGCNPFAADTPDLGQSAQQQGAANIDTARTQGRINNPNITNPYGTQTVNWGGGFDQSGYDAAMKAWRESPTFMPEPSRSTFTTGQSDQPTITQTLNPTGQKILDATQQAQLGLANTGNSLLRNASGTLGQPFQYQGPGINMSFSPQSGVNNQQYSPTFNKDWINQGGEISKDPNLSQYGQASITAPGGQISSGPSMGQYGYAKGMGAADFGLAGAHVDRTPINYGSPMGKYGYAMQGTAGPNLQGQVDTSGVANMPVNAGMTGQNAIMSRLMPQIQQSNNASDAQLANQGIVQGSEAYDNAMRVRNQANNDLLTQAALQGIGLDLTANNQGFNQALSSGQFANQAQMSGFGANQANAALYNQGLGQNYQQDINSQRAQNEAQNQNFNQGFGIQNLQNQAVAQNFGQGLEAQKLTNAAIGQNYTTDMGLTGLQNAAQQQGYNQSMGVQGAQNAAILQNQNAGLAQQGAVNQAQQQQFGQNAATNQFYNQANNQTFQNNLSAQQAYNQAQNQNYNQGLASAQFGNTAQQQAMAQQLQQYGLPLNMISALMSGSQVQTPQFQGYNPTNVQAPNIYGAAQQQAGIGSAANNNFMSGLMNMGASYMMGPYQGLGNAALKVMGI